MDPYVHGTFFWAESLNGGELSDFLRDLRTDDVYRIAIVK